MSRLPDILSHIHWLLGGGSVTILYAAGKLAALPVSGIALGETPFERWSASIRRRITGWARGTGQTVASRSAWGQVLLDTAELRRQLDVAKTTIAHLRQMEARYETLSVERGEMDEKLEEATSKISDLLRVG